MGRRSLHGIGVKKNVTVLLATGVKSSPDDRQQAVSNNSRLSKGKDKLRTWRLGVCPSLVLLKAY